MTSDDDGERRRHALVALLDVLYLRARVAPVSIPKTTAPPPSDDVERHVPVALSELRFSFDGEEKMVIFDLTPTTGSRFETIGGRRFVVYEDENRRMNVHVEIGDPIVGGGGVVVEDRSGNLVAFRKEQVRVEVVRTPYANVEYGVIGEERPLSAIVNVPSTFASTDEIFANTDVENLHVARPARPSDSDGDNRNYTHFIDARSSDNFPEWIKAMRHATWVSEGVFTLSPTPFGTEHDGLVTAMFKKKFTLDGDDDVFVMDDAAWAGIGMILYPIPRRVGSLRSPAIVSVALGRSNRSNRSEPTRVDGTYVIRDQSLDESFQNPSVTNFGGEFEVVGHVFGLDEEPLNAVALFKKNAHGLANRPVNHMELKIVDGRVTSFPEGSVSHLAIIETNDQRWYFEKAFLDDVNATPRYEEGDTDRTSDDIFYEFSSKWEHGTIARAFPLAPRGNQNARSVVVKRV